MLEIVHVQHLTEKSLKPSPSASVISESRSDPKHAAVMQASGAQRAHSTCQTPVSCPSISEEGTEGKTNQSLVTLAGQPVAGQRGTVDQLIVVTCAAEFW
ncbi:hypothetical protein OPT61_g6225 [Boeremia exigua]|uniref:Uncharacterized protein n=1 Tax=Boeremia exigua TaxID=749465 RepID=A0ACC2I7Q8_9PLEO|nr:hypothetical protein OPT61_g6225 [Boeremia exigua]